MQGAAPRALSQAAGSSWPSLQWWIRHSIESPLLAGAPTLATAASVRLGVQAPFEVKTGEFDLSNLGQPGDVGVTLIDLTLVVDPLDVILVGDRYDLVLET